MPNIQMTNKRIINKHDIEANWLKAKNFIPLKAETIVYDIEIDAEGRTLELPEGRTIPYTYERIKMGDGKTNVKDLPFIDENKQDKFAQIINNEDGIILTPNNNLDIIGKRDTCILLGTTPDENGQPTTYVTLGDDSVLQAQAPAGIYLGSDASTINLSDSIDLISGASASITTGDGEALVLTTNSAPIVANGLYILPPNNNFESETQGFADPTMETSAVNLRYFNAHNNNIMIKLASNICTDNTFDYSEFENGFTDLWNKMTQYEIILLVATTTGCVSTTSNVILTKNNAGNAFSGDCVVMTQDGKGYLHGSEWAIRVTADGFTTDWSCGVQKLVVYGI